MKENVILVIGSGEDAVSYPVSQDIDFVTNVNVAFGVSEQTGIEFITVSIILQDQTITNDYSLNAFPEMKIIGEDGKIQYIDRRIKGKIKSIIKVKGEIRK